MRSTIKVIGIFTIFALAAFAVGCGGTTPASTAKTVATGPAGNNLTATISSASGTLKKGSQEISLTFADASGKPVDVGSVAFNAHMAEMGSMAAMNNAGVLTTTSTPGVYKCKLDLDMAGEWQAQITYEGPAGKGSFSLPVVAK